jgi:hypothetical protein
VLHIYIYIYIYDISSQRVNDLTLILLTWRNWWTPNNASKWQMGFNSAFKGLMYSNNRTGRLSKNQKIIYIYFNFTTPCTFALFFCSNVLNKRPPVLVIHFSFYLISLYRVIKKVSVHLMITVQNWWFEDVHHRTHSECGPCYSEHGLREHSPACQ